MRRRKIRALDIAREIDPELAERVEKRSKALNGIELIARYAIFRCINGDEDGPDWIELAKTLYNSFPEYYHTSKPEYYYNEAKKLDYWIKIWEEKSKAVKQERFLI